MFAKTIAWAVVALSIIIVPPGSATDAAPPTLTEAVTTDDGVRLAWQPPLDAHVEGYVLYRHTPDGTALIPLEANTRSYLDAKVATPFITYQVTAIVEGDETLPSNPLAPTEYPHCPQGEPYFWVTTSPPFVDLNDACFFPLPP